MGAGINEEQGVGEGQGVRIKWGQGVRSKRVGLSEEQGQ